MVIWNLIHHLIPPNYSSLLKLLAIAISAINAAFAASADSLLEIYSVILSLHSSIIEFKFDSTSLITLDALSISHFPKDSLKKLNLKKLYLLVLYYHYKIQL